MTITLRRTSNNGKHYYYTIHDRQSGLFMHYTLTVVWGPRVDRGRQKLYTFNTRMEQDTALRFLIAKRINAGYQIFYSYARKRSYLKVFHEFSKERAAVNSKAPESGRLAN